MIPSLEDLLLLARLSSLEYTTDVDALAAGVNALGLGFVGQVGNAERQALVADWTARKRPVVIFQGTRVLENTDLAEIGDDLDLHKMTAPNGAGFVHRGFFAPVADIWPAIVRLLPADAAPIYAGHSLGGVSAHYGPAFRAGDAVSFGAPKGADAAYWASLYAAGGAPVRIVHEEDFAPGWSPALPWSTHPAGAIGWLHCGRLYRVERRTTWFNESLIDHSVDRYVAALASLAERPSARAA